MMQPSHHRRSVRPSHRFDLRPSPRHHPLMQRSIHQHPLLFTAAQQLVDASVERWLKGVRDQGNQGSCSGQSTAAARDVLFGSANGKLIPEQRAAAYCYGRARMGEGTWPRDSGACLADEYAVLQGFGCCGESDMPYEDWDPAEPIPAIADVDALPFRIKDAGTVDLDDPQKVLQVLAAGIPVSIGIPVYESYEDVGPDGVLPIPDQNKEALLGGHANLIVASDVKRKLWKSLNSWGVDWGDHGFCYIPWRDYPWMEAVAGIV